MSQLWTELNDDDIEFCTECGYNLFGKNVTETPKGFFDNISEKTSFSIIVFSFVIFGIFLFVGSLFWMSFLSSGTIDFLTYIMMTIVFAVFFGGIFTGYFGCRDESYVIPNFSVYMGSIFAVVLSGIGLIFTFLMGILSMLSSFFSSMGGNSAYGSTYQSATPSYTPNIDLSGVFEIILLILLIPVAAYFGVYLGYFLKQNI